MEYDSLKKTILLMLAVLGLGLGFAAYAQPDPTEVLEEIAAYVDGAVDLCNQNGGFYACYQAAWEEGNTYLDELIATECANNGCGPLIWAQLVYVVQWYDGYWASYGYNF